MSPRYQRSIDYLQALNGLDRMYSLSDFMTAALGNVTRINSLQGGKDKNWVALSYTNGLQGASFTISKLETRIGTGKLMKSFRNTKHKLQREHCHSGDGL